MRIAVLALGCTGQVLRARRPCAALGVGLVAVGTDVALGFSIPLLLVFVDLLYCAALHGSRRTSHTVVTAALVLTTAAAVVAAVLTRDLRVTLLAVLQGAGLLLVPGFWGSEVRQHRDAAATERANAAQAARIAELDRQAAVGAAGLSRRGPVQPTDRAAALHLRGDLRVQAAIPAQELGLARG